MGPRGPQLCHNVAWHPPLSLSSFEAGKVSLASVMRNAYSVISSGQGPASSLLLFWTFYPQRKKCPTGGPAIPCLSSSGLRSSLILIHFIQDNTFYSPSCNPVCSQRRSEAQWWPGTQRERAQLGAHHNAAILTWNPKGKGTAGCPSRCCHCWPEHKGKSHSRVPVLMLPFSA